MEKISKQLSGTSKYTVGVKPFVTIALPRRSALEARIGAKIKNLHWLGIADAQGSQMALEDPPKRQQLPSS